MGPSSSDVVKKLLEATSDDAWRSLGSEKKRKKPLNTKGKEAAVASREDVVSWYVQSIVAFDHTLARRSQRNAGQSLDRYGKETMKKVTSRRSDESSQSLQHKPTIHKRRYRKELEQKRLREIAKQLQRAAKRQKKQA